MSNSNNTACDLPVMGLGGVSPGIRSLSGRTLIDGIDEGDSVHAMSATPTGNRIVAGTKKGKLLVLDRVDDAHYALSQMMDQGAPVIAVHCFDQENFVSSDTTFRCLFWAHPFSSPYVVRSPDPVCAFVSAGGVLAGLTITGSVLLWEHGFEAPPRHLKAPAPPKPYAWVNGIYSAVCNSILFPANDGALTRIDLKSYCVTTHYAHMGEFYALHELDDDRLLTIGCRDGRACFWRSSPLSIETELSVPAGVFALMLTGDIEAPFALIHEDGRAFRCTVDDGHLAPKGEPLSGDFRCGVGVSMGEHRKTLQRRREQRIDGLVQWLQAKLAAGDIASCAEPIEALRAEGREDLALAFEAEMAAVNRDAPTELARRLALCALLPNSEGSLPSLWKLARLLVRLFLYERASEVIKRIAVIVPDQAPGEESGLVRHLASVAATRYCVVQMESVSNIRLLIKAWDVVQSPWHIRTLLRTWDGIDCHSLSFSADDLIQVCKSQCDEDGAAASVNVQSVELHVASGWEIADSQEFVLFKSSLPEYKGIEIALQLQAEANQVVAYPALLFSPAPPARAEDVAKHNQTCIETITALIEQGRGRHWISMTAHLAERALKRLVSERLAEARRRTKR